MREPDLGSALVLALIVATVLVAGGMRPRHLGHGRRSVPSPSSPSSPIAEPYRRARAAHVPRTRSPTRPTRATRSRSRSSRSAAAGSPASASAPGAAKWNFLPNAHTDFIFAIIGEELGLIGVPARARAVRRVRASSASASRCARPTGSGRCSRPAITMWIVGQAVINIGAVVGLLPVTGIPLPFVSFGGSSLVITMFAAGMLANVAPARSPSATSVRRDGERDLRAASPVAAPVVTSIPRSRSPRSSSRRGHPRDSIRFVGSHARARGTAVPEAGLRDRPAARAGLRPRARRQALARNLAHRVGHRGGARPARSGSCGGRRPAVVVGVGGYASLPALVAGAAPAHPDGRPRGRRPPRARQPHRGPPRRARRGVAPRHAAAAARWSPATRSGPRSSAVRARAGDAAARGGGRREPRRAAHQPRRARALRAAGATATTW